GYKKYIITHQGNSQVKDCKIDLLTQQYEKFSISSGETIDSGFTIFNAIVTSLKYLDQDYSRKNHVRKFLRALPLNLKVYKMILENDDIASKTIKEKVKSLALKAKVSKEQTSGDNDSQRGSDENIDEEEVKAFNLMPRNFQELGVIAKMVMNLNMTQLVSWRSTLKRINDLEFEVKKLEKEKEVDKPSKKYDVLTEKVDSLKCKISKLQDEALSFSKFNKSSIVLDDMLSRQNYSKIRKVLDFLRIRNPLPVPLVVKSRSLLSNFAKPVGHQTRFANDEGRTTKLRIDILMIQQHQENLKQAFIDYASLRTDKAGASQVARLSKFEADFKQQQGEMTNKIDTFLKEINNRMMGALPSDTVKNLKLDINPTSSVLFARSYLMEIPEACPILSIRTLKALEDEYKDLRLNLPVLEVLAHAPLYNALLDKHVESLELGKMGPHSFKTKNVLRLANGTKSYLIGIIRNVEVYVGKLKLLEDFYIIDIEKGPTCPLLVRRRFLATASTVIDCKKAKIAVGEGITKSIFGVKEIGLGHVGTPYWTTLAKRNSYESQPSTSDIVPKIDDVSLVDGVFDGAFGGDGEEDFVMGEGVVVLSSLLDISTKSCLGGMMGKECFPVRSLHHFHHYHHCWDERKMANQRRTRKKWKTDLFSCHDPFESFALIEQQEDT
nr:hypothetical protein [Tanacetum cinerariifolium]